MRWFAPLVLATLFGCADESSVELRVDVLSDLVAGQEVDRVVLALGDERRETPLTGLDDLAAGITAARFEGLAPAPQRSLQASLYLGAAVILSREVLVDLSRGARTGVTVV
ncbi:MAG: hypothetical protein AAGA62_04310, partial [Bacteroidota bacterium]